MGTEAAVDTEGAEEAGKKIVVETFDTETARGQEMICDPEDRVAEVDPERVEDETVVYRCRTREERITAKGRDDRGDAETQALIQDLLEDTGQVEETRIEVPLETVEQAQDAKEAPVDWVEEAEEAPAEPPPKRKRLIPITFYMSLRAHLTHTQETTSLVDGGTRAGLLLVKRLYKDLDFVGHVEASINPFDELGFLFSPDGSSDDGKTGDTIQRRLLYGAFGKRELYGVYGKNWSVYHTVASMTDRLAAFGGRALGVYNAGTDGGGTGTGRANDVLQLRSAPGAWQYGLQYQNGTKIPGFDGLKKYDHNFGASLVFRMKSGWGIGAAYNHAVPEEVTPDMELQGFRGDSIARVLGANYQGDQVYFALNLASNENHVADIGSQFYDAYGLEAFASYLPRPDIKLNAGYEYQTPHDSHYQGDALIDALTIGAQYTFGKKTFDDMVYLEYQFNSGRSFDGGSLSNALAVGLRYRLSW